MEEPRNETPKAYPSSRWTSYEGWDYDGMKERLETFIHSINKQAFITDAEKLLGKAFTISEPFSAGQHWACFELVSTDGSLVIARARLPRHPSVSGTGTVDDEVYAMTCEAATLQFLQSRRLSIPVPRLYAYAAPGSDSALAAGCAYMLIQGFYGNTLQDVQFDICQLPPTQQDHIVTQWTAVQAELATHTFPQIGSICQVSDSGEPVLGKLSSAPLEGLAIPGPFDDTQSYFWNIVQGRLRGGCKDGEGDDDKWSKLGMKVFLDIVQNTNLYNDENSKGPFHLNHMDLGTQNILIDDDYNFLAIIDWEFAQSAPWEVNHYPMPFPLTSSPAEEASILANPQHIAYQNVSKQVAARELYKDRFRAIEHDLQINGRALAKSIADTLDSPAARIYGCFEKLGVFPGQAEDLTHEMARLAFGLTGSAMDRYFGKVSSASSEQP